MVWGSKLLGFTLHQVECPRPLRAGFSFLGLTFYYVEKRCHSGERLQSSARLPANGTHYAAAHVGARGVAGL